MTHTGTRCNFFSNKLNVKVLRIKTKRTKNGALSGTRTHATGFGDLYSIQLSYERFIGVGTS